MIYRTKVVRSVVVNATFSRRVSANTFYDSFDGTLITGNMSAFRSEQTDGESCGALQCGRGRGKSRLIGRLGFAFIDDSEIA